MVVTDKGIVAFCINCVDSVIVAGESVVEVDVEDSVVISVAVSLDVRVTISTISDAVVLTMVLFPMLDVRFVTDIGKLSLYVTLIIVVVGSLVVFCISDAVTALAVVVNNSMVVSLNSVMVTGTGIVSVIFETCSVGLGIIVVVTATFAIVKFISIFTFSAALQLYAAN